MFYSEVINEIIVVFILIFSGFAAVKSNLISEDVLKALSDVIMKITMPALLITSFNKQFSPELFSNSVQLIIISIFVYAGLIILVKKIFVT